MPDPNGSGHVLDHLFACVLKNNIQLAGKVVMELQIEESGRVSRAEALENTTRSESIAACIGGELRLLRFDPGPEGGSVVFKYPFVFKPAQD